MSVELVITIVLLLFIIFIMMTYLFPSMQYKSIYPSYINYSWPYYPIRKYWNGNYRFGRYKRHRLGRRRRF